VIEDGGWLLCSHFHPKLGRAGAGKDIVNLQSANGKHETDSELPVRFHMELPNTHERHDQKNDVLDNG
jgi:hypothetical protein